MRCLIRVFWALLRKEIRLEARGRELIVLLFGNSFILATLIGSGVSVALLDERSIQRIFPMCLWLAFFFSSSISMSRAFEAELEGRGYEGLLLAGVSGGRMFCAKLVATSLFLFLGFLLTVAFVGIGMGRQIYPVLGALLVVGSIVSLGIASLMVVLGAMAGTSRMRGALLPLLVLPLMCPFFFAGIELTTQIMERRMIDWGSPWLSMLLGADCLFVLLGWNLYEACLRD